MTDYKVTVTDPSGNSMQFVVQTPNLFPMLRLLEKVPETPNVPVTVKKKESKQEKKQVASADAKPTQKRSRTSLSETQTRMIESLIIQGNLKPAEIAEQAEVKVPIVYVIKMRLKKEGKIS